MTTLARALRWLVRHPWALALLILALMVLHAMARERTLRQELQEIRSEVSTGFDSLGAGIARQPRPVVVPAPTILPFDDDTARWDAVFAELGELRAAMRHEGADPQAVAVIRATSPGDSVTWRWGETVTARRYSIYPLPGGDRYRMDLRPASLRVAVARAQDGAWFASAWDETAGEPLAVTGLEVAEEAPRVRWEWLRWSLGAGYGSDLDGGAGPVLWGEVALLRVGKPGGLRWSIGTVGVDPYSARVGVSVGN